MLTPTGKLIDTLSVQISKELIRLPPGVVVVNLDRSLVRVTVEKKQAKSLTRKR